MTAKRSYPFINLYTILRGYGDANQLYEKNNAKRCFSHIIDECPHLRGYGDANQLYEKNNAKRCFSHIIDKCPH